MKDERLEMLYHQYHLLVKDAAFKVLHDYNLSQDVCQDVFGHMSDNRMDKEDSPEKMKNYLRTVAYHRAIDYQRVTTRRREVTYEDNRELEGMTTSHELDKSIDQKAFISKIFQDLERYRMDWYLILVRVEVCDDPIETIARELGITPELVKTKLSRAKKWLRKRYNLSYKNLM